MSEVWQDLGIIKHKWSNLTTLNKLAYMKQLTTITLLLCVGVVFGQWHPIEAGKGVIVTEKDGVLSISMDTTKPCERCPKLGSQVIIDTISSPFESPDWYFDFESQRRGDLKMYKSYSDSTGEYEVEYLLDRHGMAIIRTVWQVFADKKVKIASWKSNFIEGEDVGLQVLYAKSLPR